MIAKEYGKDINTITGQELAEIGVIYVEEMADAGVSMAARSLNLLGAPRAV